MVTDGVTIVSDDAERLVREGGVWNRSEPVYQCSRCYRVGEWTDGQAVEFGDEADEYWCQTCGHEQPLPDEFRGEFTAAVLAKAPHGMMPCSHCFNGTVRVVGVHHAIDCFSARPPEGRGNHCHDDAKPDHWHWTVEPIES